MTTTTKCVTGCSTRTYREDVLLLLNCIAENSCDLSDITIESTCCGTQVCLVRGIETLGCFTIPNQGSITQTAHGLPVITQAVLPLAYVGGAWVPAQADATANLAVLLATDTQTEADSFSALNEGFFCTDAAHGLTVGVWYALSTTVAGELVLESSLDPVTDIIQRVLFPLTETCLFLSVDLSYLKTPLPLTCEAIQDCVGAAVDAARGIAYDDALNEFSAALSLTAGNTLAQNADGLYVPTPTILTCEEVQDCVGSAVGASRGISYDDTANTFAVALDATSGNAITQTATGLFVSPAAVSCEDSQDCVGLAVAAARGISYDDTANEFSVALSLTAGNTLAQNADGLYVPTPEVTTCEYIQDCIGTSVAASRGVSYDDVANTFSVAVSAPTVNQASLASDGLFVPIGGVDPSKGMFLYDEFFTGLYTSGNIGSLGWGASASGVVANVQQIVLAANAPGVVRISKGADGAGRSAIFLDGSAIFFGGGEVVFKTRCHQANIPDGTNLYTVRVGFGDVVGTDHIDGVYFEWSEAYSNYKIKTANNSVRTSVNTSVPMIAATFFNLEIRINAAGTSAEFFIDGVSVGTITTNIPVSTARSCGIVYSVVGSSGTASRHLDVDYMTMSQIFTTAR